MAVSVYILRQMRLQCRQGLFQQIPGLLQFGFQVSYPALKIGGLLFLFVQFVLL